MQELHSVGTLAFSVSTHREGQERGREREGQKGPDSMIDKRHMGLVQICMDHVITAPQTIMLGLG